MKRKSNSFTLVEIIAVLLIVAILAAVAAPKFISLASEARLGVAQAGVNEAKASLSVALAKVYLTKQTGITGADVVASAFGSSLSTGDEVTFGDVKVAVTFGAGTSVTLAATYVGTTSLGTLTSGNGTGTWVVPTEYQ